jgi:hypothetical protein
MVGNDQTFCVAPTVTLICEEPAGADAVAAEIPGVVGKLYVDVVKVALVA